MQGQIYTFLCHVCGWYFDSFEDLRETKKEHEEITCPECLDMIKSIYEENIKIEIEFNKWADEQLEKLKNVHN